ncbi:MAG: hypothetical protein E7168_04495 [Firmicutes bacterium]|nr:hypothetical protein [Bacillota bacterium]
MRYQWDISTIRMHKEVLEELLNKEIDPDKKRVISLLINQYRNLLSQFLASKTKTANSFLIYDNSFDTCLNTLNECFCFPHHIDDNLFQIIINTLDIIRKKLNGSIIITEPKRIFYTNDDLKDFVLDFFREMLNSEEQNNVFNIFEGNVLNIQFTKENNLKYSGVTFYDPVFKKHFVNLFRDNTILDLVTVIHEIFHVLYGNNSFKNDYYDNQIYFIEELEGSFANLLVSEYLKRYFPSYEIYDSIDCYYLLEYLEKTLELFISYVALKSINNRNELRIPKINKSLKRENLALSFKTEQEILDYLRTPVYENVCYNLSYLASLDLFSVYKDDKEYGISLLKEVKSNSYQENIIEFLRSKSFSFMDDGYENLKKETQKVKLL